MSKKLWLVEAKVRVYMLSDEEPSDFDIQDEVQEEIRDNGISEAIWTQQVTDIAKVQPAWRGAILRGDNPDELTPEDVLGDDNG